MSLVPRVVVVTRPTAYEELLSTHATRSQAEFFLKQRGQTLAVAEAVHHRIHAAIAHVKAAIPLDWRRNVVLRSELDRFLFEPEDTIAVVGQDGLVANIAKYLDGQPVIGVNPTPDLFDGALVPHTPEEGARLLQPVAHGELRPEARTMVEAELDDGQTMCALNELFVGQRTHQSARYDLTLETEQSPTAPRASSSPPARARRGGRDPFTSERHSGLRLPTPTDARLAFFVREAFPSVSTSTELTEGALRERDTLRVVSRMEDGVIFGDGIERDYLPFGWGARAEVRVAKKRLMLIERRR